jgi:Transposase DDE domain group 1
VMQRVVGIALGYEDLNDHDQLRRDPVLAVLAGKLEAQRSDCAPLAGKSTLNRLELSRAEPTRYHKVSHDAAAIESLFVDLFLEAHTKAPKQIILDLDATDDPLHGNQEGKFFHGYYDCYCYLPLYIFCGRHLLAAKLHRSNIDGAAGSVEEVARIVAQIRRRWPRTRILLQLGRLDRQRLPLRLRLGELDVHHMHAVGERIGAGGKEGTGERMGYRRWPESSLVRPGEGRGFQPAMVRAHARACVSSVTPGNRRRSSTAADSSPPRSKALRIAAASASLTTNIPAAWGRTPRPASRTGDWHAFLPSPRPRYRRDDPANRGQKRP